jgi:hypothetical protein
METIATRTKDLAVIVTMAAAAGAGIAYSVKSERGYYCPQPSAASVATLFAPCQAFESDSGHEGTTVRLVPNTDMVRLSADPDLTARVEHTDAG